MLRLFQRFKQSNLTRAAFCREEGITAAQFTYWCRRFEQENNPTEASSAPITLAQVSTPILVVKEPEEDKAFSPETTSSFTQLHLPDQLTTAPATTTPPVATSPLMVLDMAEKGRLEFYTSVEASFLKALLS
jgi:transposase-like protein